MGSTRDYVVSQTFAATLQIARSRATTPSPRTVTGRFGSRVACSLEMTLPCGTLCYIAAPGLSCARSLACGFPQGSTGLLRVVILRVRWPAMRALPCLHDDERAQLAPAILAK